MIIFCGYTHLAIGLSIYIFIVKGFNNIEFNLWILLFVLLGSIFPDIDIPNSLLGRWFFLVNATGDYHRKFTHRLSGLIIFGLPIIIFNWIYGIVFMISYFGHIVGDGLTGEITFLHPLVKRKYGKKVFNKGEDLLLLLILIYCIFLIF